MILNTSEVKGYGRTVLHICYKCILFEFAYTTEFYFHTLLK